jgi:DNA-directed RNA polymerase subunit L
MKVEILNKTSNELKIKIDGEGHTFCNIIQKALLNDERVDIAGYDIPHPLTASPVIYLRTKGRSNPEIVLRDAVKEIQKDTETFGAAFDKALKESQGSS